MARREGCKRRSGQYPPCPRARVSGKAPSGNTPPAQNVASKDPGVLVKASAAGLPSNLIVAEQSPGQSNYGAITALRIRNAEELLADRTLKLPKELVRGILHKGTRGVLAGPPKSGKSWALLDLGMSVATGTPWLNWVPTMKGKVLYVNYEIMEAAFANRVRSVKAAKVEDHGPLDFSDFDIVTIRGQTMPFHDFIEERLMVGWKNVGIIREPLFRDEFELAHYYNKNFLFHPDMPTDFLDRKEASILKQLVGGDPLWANVKGDDGRMTLEGHYPIILACNGKPKIHLDQDTDAWLRRLVILNLKTPDHEQHYGKMAEMILKTESSGILNWLLEGLAKLVKDKHQLTQTPEQKARTVNLLLGSDSPSAFVRSCLVKKKDAELGVVDLYAHYQEWCRLNHVRPFPSRPFTSQAKEEIEIGMGRKLSHDLKGGNGKAKRGWKGVGILEATVPGKLENGSKGSVA